jgi:hypothetical protein
MRAPSPHLKAAEPAVDAGALFIQFMKSGLMNQGNDPRSHAEFLRDMRTKQTARQLANPATAVLLDRLEEVIR